MKSTRKSADTEMTVKQMPGQKRILAKTGYPAFIISQEGGMVTRLSRDAVNAPGAVAREKVFRCGTITGQCPVML